MKGKLLILAVIFLHLIAIGQNNNLSSHKIDSLQKLLPGSDITKQVDILNSLASHYAPIHFDSSIMYSAQALRIGTVYGYPVGIGVARYNTGNAYYFKLDMKNALLSYLSALRICEENHLTDLSASIYIQMGNINFFVQRSEKAVSYYRNAINNYKESSNQKAINDVNIRTYITMFFLGQYPSDSALSYVKKTLEYARMTKSRLGEAHALLVIGMIYLNPDVISHSSLGIQYSDSALTILDSLKNLERISVIHLNLGSYYLELSYRNIDTTLNYYETKQHYQKGYEAAMEAESDYLQVICQNGLAEIALKKGDYKLTETHLQLVESGLKNFINFSQKLTVSTPDDYFERVFQYYLMRREKTRFYQIRFDLAMAKGEYRKAIEFQQMNYKSNEEFRAEQEGRQLELLMAEAEAEKTDQKIRSLAQDNELNQLRLLRTRYILGGIGAGVVIISLFLLLFFQRKRWKAEQK